MIFFLPLFFYTQYIQTSGIIDAETTVGNGLYSIEEIAKLARERGIKVVVYTDAFLDQVQYGIPPFKNIIKKTIRMRCIKEYGIKKYINEIDRVNKLFPDMILIPGYEIRPTYYWTGNIIKKNLTLHNMQKKLLILGLEASDLNKLPVIGNIKLRQNQYRGDPGYQPFQEVIDYTINRGGVVFWTLPEAGAEERRGKVLIKMPPHPQSLLETHDYTGFGIIYEGMKKIGVPGGIWDNILKEHMQGKRQKPIWAMGEIDYHNEGEAGGKRIEEVQTVFLLKKFDRNSVIDAMKKGKMYAMRSKKEYSFSLDEFSINGKAFMGDTITLSSVPELKIRLSTCILDSMKTKIKIIRNGEIMKVLELTVPGDIKFKDEYFEAGKWIYYRLQIDGENSIILSNPIFVKFSAR